MGCCGTIIKIVMTKRQNSITGKSFRMTKCFIYSSVLDLSLDAASAGISNERILTKIETINDKVDRFMFELVERDLNISKQFANRTAEIAVNIHTVDNCKE